MDCNLFDEKKKAHQRDTQFPIDLGNAYQLGIRLANKAKEVSGK
jgi:hypothetical protein